MKVHTRMAVTAASIGILAGAAAGAACKEKSPPSETHPSSVAPNAAKHACRGQNDCKGQGGCGTDKHSCRGKNDCKGQGGCKMS